MNKKALNGSSVFFVIPFSAELDVTYMVFGLDNKNSSELTTLALSFSYRI